MFNISSIWQPSMFTNIVIYYVAIQHFKLFPKFVLGSEYVIRNLSTNLGMLNSYMFFNKNIFVSKYIILTINAYYICLMNLYTWDQMMCFYSYDHVTYVYRKITPPFKLITAFWHIFSLLKIINSLATKNSFSITHTNTLCNSITFCPYVKYVTNEHKYALLLTVIIE